MQVSSIRHTLSFLLLGALTSCSSPASSPADPTPPMPTQPGITTHTINGETFTQDPREERLAQTVAILLKGQHVRDQEINDELSRKSFALFLKSMDSEKLFLLEEDVALFRRSIDRLDDEILSGKLRLAHLASKRFSERLQQVKTIVESHLKGSFDFDKEEWRETDSEKITYAKTKEELDDRWRRVLKLELLGRVNRMQARSEDLTKSLAEEKKKKISKLTPDAIEARGKKLAVLEKALAKIPKALPERFAKAQSDLLTSYSARFVRLADEDSLAPATRFLNAITSTFDPHTTYMPPIERDNFNIHMSGTLEGIGAVLMERDHFIAVTDVVPGGASWRQGELEAGDLILSVAQEGKEEVDIGDMKINKVVKMIRGPKGTIVTLTLEKDDGSIKTISITRDKVEMQAAYAQGAILNLKGGKKVGYIYLPSFYGDTRGGDPNARTSAKDVKKLLKIFSDKKLSGIIMDVRSNGGGLLDDSRKMAGFFIKDGPIVQTLLPDGTLEVLADTDPKVEYDGEVVVLIDRFSASASEILAAALQDYDRAIVVGPGPTHGKGTVQALLDLDRMTSNSSGPSMGVLKLTVQQFFRINGSSTQQKGVSPDIGFPDSFKHLKTGERNLDNALPWSSVKAQPHSDWKLDVDKQALLAKSLSRQAKSAYFTSMEKRGELMKKRQEETRIPLMRSKYETRVKSQDDEYEALTPKSLKKPKILFSASPVKYANTKEVAPRKKGEKNKSQQWIESLRKDPALQETLFIVGDMTK